MIVNASRNNPAKAGQPASPAISVYYNGDWETNSYPTRFRFTVQKIHGRNGGQWFATDSQWIDIDSRLPMVIAQDSRYRVTRRILSRFMAHNGGRW